MLNLPVLIMKTIPRFAKKPIKKDCIPLLHERQRASKSPTMFKIILEPSFVLGHVIRPCTPPVAPLSTATAFPEALYPPIMGYENPACQEVRRRRQI